MLNYFNNNFLKSSKKTKIELYVLPLLIYLLLYVFLLEKGKNKDVEISSKLNYEEFYNKKFESSFLELFSSLEKLAKKYEISILKNEKNENIILLKAVGNKQSIFDFIKDIENLNNFTKIDFLNMNKNEETKIYTFELKINLNKITPILYILSPYWQSFIISATASSILKAVVSNKIASGACCNGAISRSISILSRAAISC